MSAGRSAAERERFLRQRALDFEEKASDARAEAGRYKAAAETERRIVEQLGRLAAEGYHVLADRKWPGSKRANVDCVVVGPSGVFIVDPKCWSGVSLGAGGITRAGKDVTDDLTPLNGLAETTRSALAEVGLPAREVHVLAVLAGWGDLSTSVGTVEVVGERKLLSRIVSGGNRLSAGQVDAVLRACVDLFAAKESVQAGVSVPSQRDRARASAAPDEIELALLTEDELQDSILGGGLLAPIEDWMTFPAPRTGPADAAFRFGAQPHPRGRGYREIRGGPASSGLAGADPSRPDSGHEFRAHDSGRAEAVVRTACSGDR